MMTTPHRRQRGFTLIELVLSMAIATVLLAGLASAMVLASRALPGADGSLGSTVDTYHVADEMAGDLLTAQSFVQMSPTAVEFKVADRDGDLNPERIRYEWSGTPGAPLTRQYNSENPLPYLEHVEQLSLAYSLEALPLQRKPRVLLVVPDASLLSAQDRAKKTAMESWGYAVTLISASAVASSFDTAIATVDAAYVSEDVFSGNLNTKLTPASIGVVIEEGQLLNDFGVASSTVSVTNDSIAIVNNTHKITTGFVIDVLPIFSTPQPMRAASGTLAAGMQTLGKRMLGPNGVLSVVDVGGALYNGGVAAGRRVKLPWGGSTFDFNSLNNNGLTLMRRSIEWAASANIVNEVNITLQTDPAPASVLETRVQILNRPRAVGS